MGMGFGGAQAAGAPPRAQVVFVEASVETKQATPSANNGMTFEGVWCFALRPRGRARGKAAIRKLRRAYLMEVEFRRYKIGLKLKQGQTVDEFAFQGTAAWFQMVADNAVTNGLTVALPPAPEDRWFGFSPPGGVRRRPRWVEDLTVCYRFRLTLSPVATPPQAVVGVITYADLDVNQHHLKSVLLLSDVEKRIRTATRAVVP